MPDCHFGIGATVGTVLPTIGAIVPAAVGVDIGCFTGDTLVPLIDGKSYSLKELAEMDKEIIVYACTASGKVVAAKATAKITRTDAEIVKVILDDGAEIRCTLEHRFMLRDGSFVEAKDLKAGESLMPLYRETDKDGYILVQQNYSGRMQKAHWIVARSGLLGKIPRFEYERTVIHHKNFDEIDNRPENLEFMSVSEHSAYHRSLVEQNEHWQSAEFEAKRVKAISDKAKTEKGHAYYAQRGTKNILKYMEENPVHFKMSVADNGKRGKHFLVTYNQSKRGRAKSKEIANRLYNCETCGEKVKSGIGLHNHRRYSHSYNHKVVSVESIIEREDVYCLTVPEYHNFALEAGVFVHNCGMIAVKTNLKRTDLKDLSSIRKGIERRIPMSAGKFNQKLTKTADERICALKELAEGKDYTTFDKHWELSLGTLGGGNHFIEICVDEEDIVWATLHSGSRGVGNKIGNHYIKKAKALMDKLRITLPDKDLAYLPEGAKEFDDYIFDLHFAQMFALANREEMMDRVLAELSTAIFGVHTKARELEAERINCHHNFTQKEYHFDKNIWITRKGAVQAKNGMSGMIPGSMGTRSYIFSGLGNKDSFESSPHGAGRRMSRAQARKEFSIAKLDETMKGIEYRKSDVLIDEIPFAYKDIDEVMEYSKELVKVEHTLKQIINCKGD